MKEKSAALPIQVIKTPPKEEEQEKKENDK